MRVALRLAVCILLLAAAVRGAAMLDDFWLDEIWSYNLARSLSSPADVLTEARVDNNHPLNTFFLYILGDRSAWAVYRIPAVLFGVGSIALAGALIRPRGPAPVVTTMLLLALSFAHVTYSTEARGYAPAAFFSLATILWATRRGSRDSTVWGASLLWAIVVAGALSHLTYLPSYAAVIVWTIWNARAEAPRDASKRLALLHGVPIGFLAGYYALFVSKLTIGGGIQNVAGRSIVEALSLVVGGPMRGMGVWLAGGFALLAGAVALRDLRRRDRDLASLLALGVFVMPGAFGVIWAARSQLNLVAVRSFFVPMVLMMVLIGAALGSAWSESRRRFAAGLVVVLILAGNAVHLARFARGGRGHYLSAVDYMVSQDGGSVIRVASDQPFRAAMVLQFYARYAPPGVRIDYIDRLAPGDEPPQWIVIHARDDSAPETALSFGSNVSYEHRATFPQYGLSGSRWHIYRVRRELFRGASVVEARRRAR